jgi:hypothetical protein
VEIFAVYCENEEFQYVKAGGTVTMNFKALMNSLRFETYLSPECVELCNKIEHNPSVIASQGKLVLLICFTTSSMYSNTEIMK